MTGSDYHGFSNNTLGFVKRIQVKDVGNGGLTENGYWWGFGAVHQTLAYRKGKGDTAAEQTEVKKEDYNYDTVSTLQMGLRSILLEVDNRVSEVRKIGSGLLDTYFDERGGYNNNNSYDAWFAPRNLSALYEHGNWHAFSGVKLKFGKEKEPEQTYQTSDIGEAYDFSKKQLFAHGGIANHFRVR